MSPIADPWFVITDGTAPLPSLGGGQPIGHWGRVLLDAVNWGVPIVQNMCGLRRECIVPWVGDRCGLRTFDSHYKRMARLRETATPVVEATYDGVHFRAGAVEMNAGQDLGQAIDALACLLGAEHFSARTLRGARLATRQRNTAKWDRHLYGCLLTRRFPPEGDGPGEDNGPAVLAGSLVWAEVPIKSERTA